MAIVAHGLLMLVLTLGVQWKRDSVPVTVEAELWSAVPVHAAPLESPEPPAPEPIRIPKPVIAPAAPIAPDPDPSIAVAQEKVRLLKEKQLLQERLEQEKRQKDALSAKKITEAKEAQDNRERVLRDKLAQQKLMQLEQQKAQTAKSDADAKKLADLRQQQIDRMNRLAGQAVGTGAPESTGTAKQSSGPSASYPGRIAARIKPNITYTYPEMILGNPAADVEVRTSPDGTIISRKLVKSSGIKSWDEAVLNAIDKTEKLPPDTDGRVIPSLTLSFRPKD